MTTLYDVPADDLLEAVAAELADRIEEPAWASFVKSGQAAELPPVQDDFWYVRAASLLRKVAIDGPIGVEQLSTEYGDAVGGSNRYRSAPSHRVDGSKKIIRVLLQELETEDLVETAEGEGRRITAEGRSFLDDLAGQVMEELDRDDLERYA